MNVDEQTARAKFNETLARLGRGGATDAQSAAVVRDAHADLAREQQRSVLIEADLFALLQVSSLDELEALMPSLCACGWRVPGDTGSRGNGPDVRVRIIPGNYQQGTKDSATVYLETFFLDQWRPHFHNVAVRFGYEKRAATVSKTRAVSAAVVAIVAAFVG